MDLASLSFDKDLHIDISRPRDIVFAGLLDEITEKMRYPDGTSMNHKLEAWPGGRWYRDLGNNTGHLWGTVQTIKPPTLLEITGPMFMSYPVINHLEFKLADTDTGTRLTLRHRAVGLIQPDHITGVSQGWREMLDDIKKTLES